jgi:hypothetical protein
MFPDRVEIKVLDKELFQTRTKDECPTELAGVHSYLSAQMKNDVASSVLA